MLSEAIDARKYAAFRCVFLPFLLASRVYRVLLGVAFSDTRLMLFFFFMLEHYG